jgi:hypothetical protein
MYDRIMHNSTSRVAVCAGVIGQMWSSDTVIRLVSCPAASAVLQRVPVKTRLLSLHTPSRLRLPVWQAACPLMPKQLVAASNLMQVRNRTMPPLPQPVRAGACHQKIIWH